METFNKLNVGQLLSTKEVRDSKDKRAFGIVTIVKFRELNLKNKQIHFRKLFRTLFKRSMTG